MPISDANVADIILVEVLVQDCGRVRMTVAKLMGLRVFCKDDVLGATAQAKSVKFQELKSTGWFYGIHLANVLKRGWHFLASIVQDHCVHRGCGSKLAKLSTTAFCQADVRSQDASLSKCARSGWPGQVC